MPRESAGITITPLPKLGMRALSSCTVRLENVFVPDDHLLGEEGKVWKHTTKTLNAERIMMSAMYLGMIDGVLEDAVEFMNQRRAFGRLIGEFQALRHSIAEITPDRQRVSCAPVFR